MAKQALGSIAAARVRIVRPLLGHVGLRALPPEVAIQLAYDVLLGRPADEAGLRTYVAKIMSGSLTRDEVVQWIKGSSEYENHPNFSGRSALTPSINASRCRFIRSLPQADHIVDLGGVSLGDRRGALVGAGYPYDFAQLVIIDLPSAERHELYRLAESPLEYRSERGPVTYRYHSMADLSGIADASVDLVYSGQSIEHVTPEDGVRVVREAFRVLRPGGSFALDTPNRAVTRLYQEEFTDPDHKIEYTWPDLEALLHDAGFTIASAQGLNYAGRSVRSGIFDIDEVSGNCGVFDAIAECYILAVVATKPI